MLSVDVDRGSGRLFVTREEPHRILEFILESDSTWTRQFDYADRKSDRLMAIRTYRNQNFISSYYQSDGETRTLEYRSRRSGSPGEVIRLNYKPAGDTLNIHLEYNRSLGEEPFLSGSGSLETSSDQLTSLAIESTLIPSSGSTTPIRLNVHADELAQEGNQEQQNVQNPRSFENISPRKFIEILLSDSAVKPPSDVPESTVVQTTDADTNSGEIMSENRLSPDTQSDPIPHSDTSLGKDGSRGPKETTNRTDDWPEAPKRSGETIVRSSADGYPRSVPPTGFARARRHYESGELNRAAAVLEDLAETYPKSVNVPFLLGVIEYERDQPGKAAQYFRAVIQMEHDPQLRDWSRIYLRLLGSQDEGS